MLAVSLFVKVLINQKVAGSSLVNVQLVTLKLTLIMKLIYYYYLNENVYRYNSDGLVVRVLD